MKKKAQVIPLPNEKRLNYGLKIGDLNLSEFFKKFSILDKFQQLAGGTRTGYYLYFTTDEEIKEGDWVYRPTDNIILQCTANMLISVKHLGLIWNKENRKIVATTNPDLWKAKWKSGEYEPNTPMQKIVSGIPKIPDDFIQAYVREQGAIKEVMLEYENDHEGYTGHDSFEGYRLKLRPNGTVIISRVKPITFTKEEIMKKLEDIHPGLVSNEYQNPFIYKSIKKWYDELKNS